MRRLLVGGTAGIAVAAASIVACSLRDTSYLQAGSPGIDGGPSPSEGGGDAPPTSDGGATRTATTIATGLVAPRLLTQDATTLYWLDNDGTLVAYKKDGSEATPRAVASIGAATTFLVADREDTGPSLFYASGAQVFSVPKAGGTPVAIATTDPRPAALAVDDNYVFVMADDEDSAEISHVTRFGRAGGAGTKLRESEGGFLYGIAVQGNDVFWDEGDEKFFSLPKDSVADAGPTTYTATGAAVESATGPFAFVVDDKAIYFSNASDVRALGRVASSSSTLLIGYGDSVDTVTNIALDDSYVYAIDTRIGGTLMRTTKDGRGTPEKMLADLDKPTSLVVDGTSVYLTLEGPPGSVVKCAR